MPPTSVGGAVQHSSTKNERVVRLGHASRGPKGYNGGRMDELDVAKLRASFNEANDCARLIAILSPT